MSSKFRIALLIVLALFVIGLIVYSMFVEGEMNKGDLLKALLVLAGLITSIIKIKSGSRPSATLSRYEKTYGDIIGNAFSDNKTDRKRLLEVVRCYAEDDLKNGLSKAEKLWESCKTVNDKKAVGIFKALILTDLGCTGDAIALYEHLIDDLLIQNDTVYSNLGLLYTNGGDNETGMKYYTLATQVNPKNATAWTNTAFSHIRLFEIDEAIECAEKAIKLNYKMYNAYEVLAAAYTYKGEKELAEKYFHTAIVNGADKASLNDFVSRFEPDENSQDE